MEVDEFFWDGDAEAVADHSEFDIKVFVFEAFEVFVVFEVSWMVAYFCAGRAREDAEGESIFEKGSFVGGNVAQGAKDNMVKEVFHRCIYCGCTQKVYKYFVEHSI